jgi:S1-C subfamily serine protease
MRARAVLLELVQRSSGTGKRGFVGIGLLLHAFFDKNGEVNFAIRVSQVMPDTPAQKAGLRVDDIITGIDNTALADKDATQRFMDIVGAMPPGREVTLKYRRDGKDLEAKVTLMPRPDLPDDNTPKTDPEKLLRDWLAARKEAAGEP